MVLSFSSFATDMAYSFVFVVHTITMLEVNATYITIHYITFFFQGITAPVKDYSIPAGSQSTRFFATVCAVANIVFVYNTGMLPEIQVSHCIDN
jgi:hypothetical protein